MYFPALGCDVNVIQEWQKEEVEALRPKEQGSSALSQSKGNTLLLGFTYTVFIYYRINTAVGRVICQLASPVQKTQVCSVCKCHLLDS